VTTLSRDGYGPVEYTRAPSGVFTEWGGRSGISTRAATPATTERVPSPMAVTGVVSPLIPERALVVRISDTESGYAKLTWRTAWRALKSAEESSWRTADPTVYASAPGAFQVAHATTGDDFFGGLLRFRFADEKAYLQLVSQPGLSCFVMLDRSAHRFLSCKFRHNRG
jgi:hypothetical protein